MITKTILEELNSLTYTEITSGTDDLFGFTILAQTAGEFVPFYIAWDAAGDNATLYPASGYQYPDFHPKNTVICYAKAVSGTPTLTVIPSKSNAKPTSFFARR